MPEREHNSEWFPKLVVGVAIAETKRTLARCFNADTRRMLSFSLDNEPAFSDKALSNFARDNYIARDLLSRDLPLGTLFDTQKTTYFVEATQNGDRYHLSLDKLKPVLKFTDRVEDREIASLAAILVFRYLTKGYLENIPEGRVITKDPRAIDHYSKELITYLENMAAGSQKESELRAYFEELQRVISASDDVAIVGRGLEMNMKLKGLTILYLLRPHQLALIDLMTDSAEVTFIRNMQNKHLWFMGPDRWKIFPSKVPANDTFKQAIDETQKFLEELELAGNQPVILERFRTSILAAQVGIDFIEEELQGEIETECAEIFQEKSEIQNEPEKENSSKSPKEKPKKKKKRNTSPAPKQVFKKKKKEITESSNQVAAEEDETETEEKQLGVISIKETVMSGDDKTEQSRKFDQEPFIAVHRNGAHPPESSLGTFRHEEQSKTNIDEETEKPRASVIRRQRRKPNISDRIARDAFELVNDILLEEQAKRYGSGSTWTLGMAIENRSRDKK